MGANIRGLLRGHFEDAVDAMKEKLSLVSLETIRKELQERVDKKSPLKREEPVSSCRIPAIMKKILSQSMLATSFSDVFSIPVKYEESLTWL